MTLVPGFSLKAPEAIQCPYPLYEQLRNEAPVFYDPQLRIFIVTRYEFIKQITSDPDLFSSQPDRAVQAIFTDDQEVLEMYRTEGGYAPCLTLAVTDPPEHRR